MSNAAQIRDWLAETREKSQLRVNRIAFQDCAKWHFQDGRMCHHTGRFFSIAGIRVDDVGLATHDRQLAMIDQPEVGWLGLIVRKTPSGIEWLLQAKTEPGNILATQLAPSIQATRSNYKRAHGGRPTQFLDLFRGAQTFLSDAPHSEQGTRFLWKFNRNSVLALPEGETLDLTGLEHWMWCSSTVIRELLADDYSVNTDARSVIAAAPWSLLAAEGLLFSAPVLAESYEQQHGHMYTTMLLNRTNPLRRRQVPQWEPVALDNPDEWAMIDGELCDSHEREAVTCFEIDVKGREVDNWCQPFLTQAEHGDHVLFMRLTKTGAEFFVRTYHEVGFATRKEYGPSRHSLFKTPGEMRGWDAAQRSIELLRINQSDEGGRFMEADSSYRIVLVQETPPRVHYPFGQWVSLNALEQIVARPGTTTNELRTLVSLVLSQAFDTVCSAL